MTRLRVPLKNFAIDLLWHMRCSSRMLRNAQRTRPDGAAIAIGAARSVVKG